MTSADITAAEAARRLGVTRESTSKWAQEGRFPGARLEQFGKVRLWFIPEESVEAMRREREGRRAEDT